MTVLSREENGGAGELSVYLKKIFQNILLDSAKLKEMFGDKVPTAAQLVHLQSQKIASVESKIENILQLHSLEQDEFGHLREAVDLCELITAVVEEVKKSKACPKKTAVELRLPQIKPRVRLHRELFRKWTAWCIMQLCQKDTVIHVLIEISLRDHSILLKIAPKRLAGEFTPSWKGLDFMCAERYFGLENGQVILDKNKGIDIVLPVVMDISRTVAEKGGDEDVDFLKKVHEGEELPTLSPIAVRIVELASDKTSSAQDIARVVTVDPALTARLLKVVNSPFYGFAKEITSVSQAVAILGMKAVRTLSLCLTVIDSLSADSDTTFDYHDFWQRSFASAVTCRLTAQKLGLHIDEEAFIAGLTQNIGSLIFARYAPERYGKILARYYQNLDSLNDLEDKAWGVDHARLGYEIFSQWKMPLPLCNSILYHHTPEQVPENNKKLKTLVSLVHLSDIAAHVLYGENKSSKLGELKLKYKEMLNIDDDEIDEIMEHVSDETETVAKEFNFTIDKPQDYAKILQNANIELGRINLDYEQLTRELTSEKKRAEKLAKKLQEANRLLEKEVNTDGLTNLYNHRFFYEIITREFANAKRHNFPLSCIMMDLDFFKKVNDTYGHREGDTILATVGKILSKAIREGDLAARYGGEEFAVILPNTGINEAAVVAERIRLTVENTTFTDNVIKGKQTISVGVACFKDNNVDKATELVELADKGVYMAKEGGRNRVVKYFHEAAS